MCAVPKPLLGKWKKGGGHRRGKDICDTLINISDEGLLFIIYKEYLKPNNKKTNDLI